MTFGTIGSIASHIIENITVSPGVSGNMVEIVDVARQHVANFTGYSIGSNAIEAKFEPAIVSFAKADAVELSNAGAGGDSLKLAELEIDGTGEQMSAQQYRLLAESQLKAIGRAVQFARSIS